MASSLFCRAILLHNVLSGGSIAFVKGIDFSSHSAIIAAYGKEFAKAGLLDPKFHRNLIVAQKRRETGHYGAESEITNEQASESYQWAEEFMRAVRAYLHKN